MRSKENDIKIAERILEAYRGSYGYRKTYSGHYAARDEPGERDSAEVRAHNAASKRYMERKRRKQQAREKLKGKNAVPIKDGKPMFEDKTNKLAAQQTWGKSLAGQTFYSICPDNSNYFKTIFIRFNPFTNAMQPMMSNPIYGTPPDGMEEINPLLLQRLMRLQQTTTFQSF